MILFSDRALEIVIVGKCLEARSLADAQAPALRRIVVDKVSDHCEDSMNSCKSSVSPVNSALLAQDLVDPWAKHRDETLRVVGQPFLNGFP